MINILVWLLAFIMQAGLLGIVMYSVRQLLVHCERINAKAAL